MDKSINEQNSVLDTENTDTTNKITFEVIDTDIQESHIQNHLVPPVTEVSNLKNIMNPKINEKETLIKATNRLFYKHQVWSSYHELRKHTKYFDAYWGFIDAQTCMTIHCNRYGKTQVRRSCPNKVICTTSQTLKYNFHWIISFKYANKEDHLNSDANRCLIVIINAVLEHGNECISSKDQFTYCKNKAGLYSNVTSLVLQYLVSYMFIKTNGFADAGYIRSLIRKASHNITRFV